jgi:V/A-type H+-transporting ATPase subunit C
LSKLKDTDYLSISARVRAMENRLLTRERLERMLEARSNDEAAKVLTECGYGDFGTLSSASLEEELKQSRSVIYQDLRSAVPDSRLIDVFRIKYDYHNAKVLLKSQAVGTDETRLLVNGGRYTADALREAFVKEDFRSWSVPFREAVARAKETLAASGDPQAADFILDKAYFAEMISIAEEVGSEFLTGYVKLSIDAANLRSAVRAARMGRGADFLSQVLVPGGNVSEKSAAAAGANELAALFGGGALAEAAALGSTLMSAGSGHLTEFERLCDNAVMHYLSSAHYVPFGEQVPVAYLCAREAELTAIRIIMTGRMAGLDTEIIRERLRESYV